MNKTNALLFIKSKLKFILILSVALLSFENKPKKTDTANKKPNIIYILADDMGYGDLQRNNAKSKIPTPNLNTLSDEGIRFTDGHAPAQICTPSRYSILTGRYYWRNNIYKKIGWRVVTPWVEPIIEENRLTLPKMLKSKGYNTACIGKWHLGFNWKLKKDGKKGGDYKDLDYTQKIGGGPTTRGFDYFFGVDSPNSTYAFIENDRHTEIPVQEPYHSYAKDRTNKTAVNWTFEGILPTLAKKAFDYIEDNSKKENPFFLYFPLTAPHTPIAPSKKFLGKSEAGAYGDFVVEIDWIVGQIVKKLKEQGIYDNTIIVFSSDNGSPERDGADYVGSLKSIAKYGHKPNAPYRGMKADLWEGGHRVPFLVRWPEVTEPGSMSNVTVSQVDFMRTFADYLNIPLPMNAAEDSYNILSALKGKQSNGHDPLIIKDVNYPLIKSGDWKLILAKGPTGFSRHAGEKAPEGAPEGQLYNISTDKSEKTNLFNERPDKVKELKELLAKYQNTGSNVFFNN